MAGGIILRLTYGYEVQYPHDDYVELIERANDNFSRSSVPGAFLVDVFPVLKYLPEWLPGTDFLRLAREWKKDTVASADVPYAYTKKQIVCLLRPFFIVCLTLSSGYRKRRSFLHFNWT